MTEGGSLIFPVAKAAYKNRNHIVKAWKWIVNKALGQKTTIAFTGLAGAGKTVLFDYLCGIAYQKGYKPPGTSEKAEKALQKIPKDELRKEPKRRIALTVVPGAPSQPRINTIEDLFSEQHGVNGIVHVVCNGYIFLRQVDARQALIRQFGLKTVAEFTEFQRKEEIKDLESICQLLAQSIQKYQRPSWMIVALTKSDLYYDSIQEDIEYYSPFHESQFSVKLKKLQHLVGAANFRWGTIPVCCWLEDFEWNNQIVVLLT